MPNDLAHVQNEIKANERRIEEARQKADYNHTMERQRKDDGRDDRANTYSQEAERYEQQEQELRAVNEQLANQQQDLQQQIDSLIQQRDRLKIDHDAQLRQLDDQLARLRGTGLIL